MQALTVNQIKKVQGLVEETNECSNVEMKMKECEEERLKIPIMIENVLHKSVPVNNDMVGEGSVCSPGTNCGIFSLVQHEVLLY